MTTTTTVPSPPGNLVMEWERIEDEDLAGGNISTLVAGGPGFVAAGWSSVWVSEEGREWERVPASEFGDSAAVNDVVSSPDGLLIAVGSVGEDDLLRPAVWTSDDGRSWERQAAADPDLGVVGGFTEVVWGSDGVVAVTVERGEGWDWPGPTAPFSGMWFSADALDWEQVAAAGDEQWPDAHVVELLSWNDSYYAVGYRERVELGADGTPVGFVMTPRTSVWRSSDGRTWEWIHFSQGTGDVGLPDGIPDWGAWAEGAVATETGMVAGGSILSWYEPPEQWSLGIWRTDDGETWSLLPAEFETPGREVAGSTIKPLAGDDERLIALEMYDYIWASDDRGDTWHQVAVLATEHECEEQPIIWALAYDGTTFIAAGWVCDDALVWRGEWAER